MASKNRNLFMLNAGAKFIDHLLAAQHDEL